jgi:hypothetical protein
MKTKINLIVTINSDGLEDEKDLVQQIQAISNFCKIKNQHGCKVNGRKLSFEINSDKMIVCD